MKKDHPRLCGEKPAAANSSALIPGSPPPMRGKDVSMMGDTFKYGITPAYAGKSILSKNRQWFY